ncbi:HGxxPAAW family protein [Streptomyces sp. NPDC020898]|uniref:HGxxPAAW family protein n=1 Tax=Streptomyces sp. NPDC020898 TaxID=3365101 RepID=UPI0037B006CB
MSAHDEGHTVAGWTGTAIATAGSTVLGLGVVMVSAPVMSGGIAMLAVAWLVTWVLHLAGWGKPPGVRPVGEWGMRVRDRSARAGHTGCLGCRLAGRERRAAGAERTVAVAEVVVPERV